MVDSKNTENEGEESQTFESAFSQLQDLVKKLEGGALSLEDSLKVFEEGVKLTRFCQQSLTVAEQKVEQLIKIGGDGKIQTKAFEE
ncbi:MAG: exodeoxyribonuclease VII small subunit [Cryobacterium sp.]|nr:exodeoxyribonuclease VII small subunit [Oligoflexia bacterium]